MIYPLLYTYLCSVHPLRRQPPLQRSVAVSSLKLFVLSAENTALQHIRANAINPESPFGTIVSIFSIDSPVLVYTFCMLLLIVILHYTTKRLICQCVFIGIAQISFKANVQTVFSRPSITFYHCSLYTSLMPQIPTQPNARKGSFYRSPSAGI